MVDLLDKCSKGHTFNDRKVEDEDYWKHNIP